MADNVTTEELENALHDLAESMGLSTVEYVQSLGYATVAEVTAQGSDFQAQIDAITEMEDNGVESLAEKIKAIHDVLSDEDGVVQQIFTKIQENKQLVVDETARASGVEADLQNQVTANLNKGNSNATAISDLSGVVSANKTASEDADTALSGRVTATEGDLTTLKGDATVEGSVDYKVEQERLRAVAAEASNRATSDENIATAKAEAIAHADSINGTEVTRASGVEADLQAQINDITGGAGETSLSSLSDALDAEISRATDIESGLRTDVDGANARATVLETRATDIENTLNDTTDADDNLVKGHKTRISDLESGLSAEAATRIAELTQAITDMQTYSDARDLKASSMNMCSIGNKFRSALGLADNTCDGGGDGDGAVV